MDVLAAGCGLIALAPLLACVAALIRWEDGGPILFRQERVGRGGRRFSMYKFRSMSCDAEARRADLQSGEHDGDEVRFKMRRDPRVTRVGRWIRRFSIDEVPQLWNIVRGDMALVGPRPPLPQEVATYDWREWHRLDVRPGLTCTWQITGRSEIPFPRQVALDLEYILDPSLRRDAALVLGTVPAVLSGHGAY